MHDRVSLTHAERRRIALGTMLPLFLGSMDATVLASALPTIGRDLGVTADLPWLITVYLLAATAVTPLYGKLSDIHGRRATLSVAIGLYLAGSLVCALAPSFWVLVVGRAVHGAGGGGLTALGMVILGDLAPPKERGRYYAYFSITYATAGASGPLLGGAIAQHLHWSAIFWLNLPAGALALFIVATVLRRLPRHERPHRLDIIGAGLIVLSSLAFMLSLNLGGVRLPWGSLPVMGLLAFAAAGAALFVWRLRTAPEPLIPLGLLRSREARCAIAANAFGWGAIIGLNIYLPTYLQTVIGLSATQAGLSLMVLMGTVNIGAGVAGQIIGRVRHYKRLPVVAVAISIAATLTLAARADSLTPLQFEVLLAVIGLGFGPVAPLSTVVLQNTVPIHQFGTAIGSMNFTRMLYATMLVAAFGAVVLAPSRAASGLAVGSAAEFSHVFFAAAASLCGAFVAIWLMREKPLEAEAR